MAKLSLVKCYLARSFDALYYLVAIATVVGSVILLFTEYDEESILKPLLIANAVIFAPLLGLFLWMAFTTKRHPFRALKWLLILLLVSPIPYLAILYGTSAKLPELMKDILLAITSISPFFAGLLYWVGTLFRDCEICSSKGCEF